MIQVTVVHGWRLPWITFFVITAVHPICTFFGQKVTYTKAEPQPLALYEGEISLIKSVSPLP